MAGDDARVRPKKQGKRLRRLTGELVTPISYSYIAEQSDLADNFSEGVAVVELNEVAGLIDPDGNVFVAPQYVYIMPFDEGIALAHTGLVEITHA